MGWWRLQIGWVVYREKQFSRGVSVEVSEVAQHTAGEP